MADQPTTPRETFGVDEPDRERRLGEVMAAYFAATEAGQNLTPQELIARYPELAQELEGFFAEQDRFGSLVAHLRPVVQAAPAEATTLAGAEATVPPSQSQVPAPVATMSLEKAGGPIPDRDAATLDEPEISNPAAAEGSDAGADLPSGTNIRYFGDYELRSVLGKGGMGVVYKAKQLSLNRLVAVKMIRAGTWAGDDEVRRFRNEAEAVANLDHPQIVTIHEVGQYDGQHYFSMNLVDGPSLAEHLEHFTADTRSAARLVSDVARAVHHAHQRGILHRDLKPSNIVLDPEGRPHVTDFGLAKRIEGNESLSASGSIAGTPQYMSPEQASGRKGTVTTAADVYGLGAILYSTLTGRPPFQSDSVMETLEQVRKRAPEPPSRTNRRVPHDLEVICLKCLDKDPRRRYDSAAALSDDLERCLRGEPILARRAGTWERVLKWSRRRPAAASLVVMSGVALLTLVGLGVALFFHSRLQYLHSRLEVAYDEKNAALARELTFLYQNRVMFAERELNDNDPDRAGLLLEDCPADRRHWEWNYLKRQCRTELLKFQAHRSKVFALAISPDSRLIATGTEGEETVRLWDAEARSEVRSLPGHVLGVYSVAFSPDATLIASAGGSLDGRDSVLIREVATGRTVRSLPVETGYVSTLDLSRDGHKLAVASGETRSENWVKLCDTRTGKVVRTISVGADPVYYPSFSPDGKFVLATVGSTNFMDPVGKLNEIRVWDANAGNLRFVIPAKDRPYNSARYSRDGRVIATCGYDGTVRLWDAAQGREPRMTLRGHTDCVNFVAFTTDGRRLASTSDDGSTKVWNTETGQELMSFRGNGGGVYAVTFSADDRRLIVGGSDGTVKVWDATATPAALTLTGAPSRVSAVAFSPDGRTVVAGGLDHRLRVWDVRNGRLISTLRGHNHPVWGVAFSPDGTRISSAGGDWRYPDQLGEVMIWETLSGRVIYSLRAHNGIAFSVAFSPDGRRLVSGGGDLQTPGHEVILWDVVMGQRLRSLTGMEVGVESVAFSPDGRRIAAASYPDIHTWESETGSPSVRCKGLTLWNSVLFSPDSRRIIATGTDGTIRVWDATTGRVIRDLKGHKLLAHGVGISPDGRRIATSSVDQTVKIWDWDADTDQELISLRGHIGPVWSVAFSPDGTRIASADGSGLVKIWDGSPIDGGAR